MKLVLVGPVYPYRGGIAHYTAMLGQALQAQHETRIISFRRQYPAWLYPGRSDRDPSQRPLRISADYLLEPLNPWSWLRAARAIGAGRPDLILLQTWTTFWLPATGALAALCRRRGLRVAYLIHNVLPHEPRWWDRPLARWAYWQGDRFITHTEAERRRLLALLPAAQAEVCAMPPFDGFEPAAVSQREARRALGLPETGPLLLFFGIVRPYKGLDLLLDALARLRRQGRPVQLVVAGEFWQAREGYAARIRDLGLAAQVCLVNRYIPNEEVGLFFAAADALAAPYVGGTQSAVAEVAAAFGRPMIVTKRVALGLAQPLRSALYVAQAETPEALAEAIEAALAGPAASPAARPAPGAAWQDLVRAIERAAA